MTSIARGISALLIVVGIFLILFHQEKIKSTLVGVVQEESESEGEDQRVVSKTGAYQNTKFKHFIDYKFGASLGKSSLKIN